MSDRQRAAPAEDSEDDIRTIGVGIRYLVFQEHNAWIGVDAARGPEETYYYISIGQGW